MTRTTRTALTLIVACAILPAVVGAQTCDGYAPGNCFILRAPAAQIAAVANAYGLTVIDVLDANTQDVVLVSEPGTIPPEDLEELVSTDPAVTEFEMLQLASLSEEAGLDMNQSLATIAGSLATQGTHSGHFEPYFVDALWNGYAEQPAVTIVSLDAAHDHPNGGFGSGIVAVIDTGVDPDHPLLQGALVPGYDFILGQAGIASEWDSLDPATAAATRSDLETIADQSYTSILEGGADAAFINPWTGAVTDQSYTSILEGMTLPPSFGHGTMVAGLIRLAAPGAQIMPLRVFDGSGTANVFEIARAIHWAVDNGAHVINMSFSTGFSSPELLRAVNYAYKNGAVVVASAGNRGGRTLRYPAAYLGAMGVASIDTDLNLSPFSSHGSDLVLLAAPGEGVISTYPGGLLAAAWGTSFSAAFVSGSVALLHESNNQGNLQEATDPYRAAYAFDTSAYRPNQTPYTDEWGKGILDAYQAAVNELGTGGGSGGGGGNPNKSN